MAWIAKQSANTKLQKRDVPYLTPVLMDKITKDIMPRYATGQGALMTTLHEVQHEYGYIPWEAMVEIAKVLGITPAQVADVVLSISRKPMEKSTGSGRIFVAKNRAGRDGLLFPINIDTAKSKFEILDDTELSLNEVVTQDNNSMKEKLREKWKEVNKKND